MSGRERFRPLSGYRLMWMMVLFDLPVDTAAHRKAANDFRNLLLDLGFARTQFSVYMKYCAGKEQVTALLNKIAVAVPNYGNVKILSITDKQYENVVSFTGRNRDPAGKNPNQLALF